MTLQATLSRGMRLSLIALAVCVWTACKPAQKPDASVKETSTKTKSGSASDDFVSKQAKTEEMPSADKLQNSATNEKASTSVSSSAASDIASALRKAQNGNDDGAVRKLTRLANGSDGAFLACYDLGVIRERQGKYEQAAKRYFQAIQKNPDFTPALENLVRLYLRKGQTQDAERIARKFVDARPKNMNHRAVLLQVDLARGKYEDVIQSAKQILRKDERNVDAMYAMAQANYHLGRHELAKWIIERALELDPKRAELYYTAGLVALELDNLPSARANFTKAVQMRPEYPEAHNDLGVIYQKARDYKSAEKQFKDAIHYFPDFTEAYLNLGNAYKGETKYKDAEIAFKKAISIDPKYADAYFNLGILYMDGQVPGMDTISRYQKAIDSFNDYKRAARSLKKKDPVDKYIAEAKKAIEVERQKQEMMRESQKDADQPAKK